MAAKLFTHIFHFFLPLFYSKCFTSKLTKSEIFDELFNSVNHFFIEQLSKGKSYNKYCRFCTFTYVLKISYQNFIQVKSYCRNSLFCLFERNRRLLLIHTGDTAVELSFWEEFWVKFDLNFFEIFVKGSID